MTKARMKANLKEEEWSGLGERMHQLWRNRNRLRLGVPVIKVEAVEALRP
jgi:hypothetical protein